MILEHQMIIFFRRAIQDYNAKLSDFGLAKDGPTGDKSHVSTRVMGTYGYAAPEYLATGDFLSLMCYHLQTKVIAKPSTIIEWDVKTGYPTLLLVLIFKARKYFVTLCLPPYIVNKPHD